MKKFRVAFLSIFLYGCATNNIYDKYAWKQQNHESDWDIDLAICLEHSEQLTQEEWEEVRRIQKEAQELQYTGTQIAEYDAEDEALYALSQIATGIMSFIGSYNDMSAEEVVREKKFITCMQEKDWGKD